MGRVPPVEGRRSKAARKLSFKPVDAINDIPNG
jgi:hypothetical protein